ncbi:hypothetical protein L1887_31854 [Cichorium endivia]|nr:hypothetical protein L1887_31854 [Cichorium endivia]
MSSTKPTFNERTQSWRSKSFGARRTTSNWEAALAISSEKRTSSENSGTGTSSEAMRNIGVARAGPLGLAYFTGTVPASIAIRSYAIRSRNWLRVSYNWSKNGKKMRREKDLGTGFVIYNHLRDHKQNSSLFESGHLIGAHRVLAVGERMLLSINETARYLCLLCDATSCFHIFRMVERPPLTFHILFRFFILGLLGMCLFQILLYIGIGYSSPTLASAIGNLTPGNTFLLAVAFRMEKIDIRSSKNQAKIFGTIIAISGAMLFTFYKGPELFHTISSSDSHNGVLLSQESNWIVGGLILVVNGIFGSFWNVLQSATSREYPDQLTIVFFYCLFGTIQCIALSLFLVQNPSDWALQPGIAMVAVVSGALYFTVIRSIIVTWCLKKKGPVFVAMFSPLLIVIASIMGVTFLGDPIHLGSVIGATIITAGFYTMMWGQSKEEKMEANLDVIDEPGSSNHKKPLLSYVDDSKC